MSLAMVGCLLAATACGTEHDRSEPELRAYFEGSEVADELAANPDARFFVDLRVDGTYAIDQRDQAIDFAYFTVQCPSMPQPISMPDFVALTGMAVDEPYWTLASVGPAFRSTGSDCVNKCFPNGDCIVICIDTEL